MLVKDLPQLFERDLLKLKEELGLYSEEEQLWVVMSGINNSAGNLTLHLIGNLDHFIGATLGKTGFVRDRDSEFSLKDVPRSSLLISIDKTILLIKGILGRLEREDLEKDYPLEKHGETVSTGYMLLHLLTHLNYHLGQVNYHRRLIV